jgi:mRNA interferase HigB
MGTCYIPLMRVIAKRTLTEFWAIHPQAQTPLRVWFQIALKAQWRSFADVRASFGSVDVVGDKRFIFNIAGNRYRLAARISFEHQRVLIKFIGTHADYDSIDPETV